MEPKPQTCGLPQLLKVYATHCHDSEPKSDKAQLKVRKLGKRLVLGAFAKPGFREIRLVKIWAYLPFPLFPGILLFNDSQSSGDQPGSRFLQPVEDGINTCPKKKARLFTFWRSRTPIGGSELGSLLKGGQGTVPRSVRFHV